MKVVTAAEMRKIDQDTIDGIGIPGIVLMETAGREIVRAIERYYPTVQRIGVLVGKGNNGGDGLVIARQLAHVGREVHIFLVSPPESFTGEARVNLDIAYNLGLRIQETSTDVSTCMKNRRCELLVDAIFGTGLHSAVREPTSTIINEINKLTIPILAVDLPSGLDADTGIPLGACVKADRTLTIGLPKRGLLLQPGAELTGQLEIVDIGFPKRVIKAQKIKVNWTTEKDAAAWLPPRASDSHKGSYGRVLVVAGSTGMTGAASLTSESALRAGAGLVTLAIPKCLNPILEVKLSEVMTLPLPETENGSLAETATQPILEFAEKTESVLAIGPGLSQNPETVVLVHQLIKENSERELGLRMIIDADGLNALAKAKELIPLLGEETVLTPHLGEMARLTDTPSPTLAADRISTTEEFAERYRGTLVLKGAPTITAYPSGRVWINATGNPGMATAGMGDVLTGLIAGLMAQNVQSNHAATLGVYLHGLAGDIAAETLGRHALITGDVLRTIPQAISSLIQN